MNKETFLQNLQFSALSSEHKQQILDIIEKNDWNVDTIELIKDIIQTDIESDMEALLPEDQVAADRATEELNTNLSAIEQSLAADMAFVEGEIHDLETMTKDLDKNVDEAHIDALKEDIAKSV